MRCPYCEKDEDKVIDSRVNTRGTSVRRRRECLGCGRRFTSFERIEEKPLMILKKDGNIELFSRDKLKRGMNSSLHKRPVTTDQLNITLDNIEDDAIEYARESHEIDSNLLGEMVLKHMFKLDEVAYIRFASVYRRFEDVKQFLNEIENLHR